MIYRIITNKGHVDTSFDFKNAESKFGKYVNYMREGYANYVMMTQQKGMYGKEEVIKRYAKN